MTSTPSPGGSFLKRVWFPPLFCGGKKRKIVYSAPPAPGPEGRPPARGGGPLKLLRGRARPTTALRKWEKGPPPLSLGRRPTPLPGAISAIKGFAPPALSGGEIKGKLYHASAAAPGLKVLPGGGGRGPS